MDDPVYSQPLGSPHKNDRTISVPAVKRTLGLSAATLAAKKEAASATGLFW